MFTFFLVLFGKTVEKLVVFQPQLAAIFESLLFRQIALWQNHCHFGRMKYARVRPELIVNKCMKGEILTGCD